MAVLEGHRNAADPADLVGGALGKIIRVLPERVAVPVRAVRAVTVPPAADETRVSPELTTALIESCAATRRLRLGYRLGARDRAMEVDPWAVVLRHSRWYLHADAAAGSLPPEAAAVRPVAARGRGARSALAHAVKAA